MTDAELRTLQDTFLALPRVRQAVRLYGDTDRIAWQLGSPSFRQVAESLLPEWADWFRRAIEREPRAGGASITLVECADDEAAPPA